MSAHFSENYVPMVNGNGRQILMDGARERALGDSRINVGCELSSTLSSPTASFPGKEAATAPSKDQLKTAPEEAEAGTAQIPRWKRLLDLACITLTFPLWLTVMALVSTWILLASPGPLLYRQERIGYRRRRFMILKFRTMKINVETQTHESYFERLMQDNCPMTKLDCHDARLIRGGRILRALGLDELPQLFNVVRGEMSLVGPRPCTPHEFDRYQPAQKERVNAPPGITGYWQVNGKNKTTFSEMIAMDIFYASHMSIWMDLSIMLKTIPAIAAQVSEALKRKTSAKLSPILDDWRSGNRRVR
jgi:lipopolysaccharide/colanic/teichoic acid biosynthesis glycosyltransferase